MAALRGTVGPYPEHETRALLGTDAATVYGFVLEQLTPIAARIGP